MRLKTKWPLGYSPLDPKVLVTPDFKNWKTTGYKSKNIAQQYVIAGRLEKGIKKIEVI